MTIDIDTTRYRIIGIFQRRDFVGKAGVKNTPNMKMTGVIIK